jgi:ABC-type amino acid transport substrate-binding protein
VLAALLALILPLMARAAPASAAALGPAVSAPAAERPLILLVDDSAEMPSARVDKGQVLDGISRDLGQLIARRLGRRLQMLALPRRRVAGALGSGEADLLCDYLPDWLPGPFLWSRAFLPNATWVVTREDRAWPGSVQGLAGQRVGAVGGYAYPELQRALGPQLVRDDAPNGAANLRKLALGRVDHLVLSQRYLQYQQRIGAFSTPLHPPLVVGSYLSQCALSPHSSLDLTALNQALTDLSADGSLERMLQRYR